MSSTTTNIGLYKKNPSTDGNDTFDINTMLNDNWDRIDAQLGAQVGVSPALTPVNLVNGMQVVTAPKGSPYNVLNITGRTLVNLLGRDGNCEDVSRWVQASSINTLDATNKVYGSNALKVAIASGTAGTAGTMQTLAVKAGKYYIFIVDAKNGTATNASVSATGVPAVNLITSTTAFGVSWVRHNPSVDASINFFLNVAGTVGNYAYFDGARAYEITASEYTAIVGMTAAQIAAKYPYVDDVKHVNSPYVIKYGENLLPPFNEWTLDSNATALLPYSLQINNSSAGSYRTSSITIPIVGGQQLTFAQTISGANCATKIESLDVSGSVLQTHFNTDNATTSIFTTHANATQIRYSLTNGNGGATGTFTFSNPMLNLGTTAKPFKPRNDDMLAFPNVQLASSMDGTVYDTLFKRDGKYFVEKRIRDMVVDGSLTFAFGNNATGYKTIIFPTVGTAVNKVSAVKYDGKILSLDQTGTQADSWGVNGANINLTIASTDSGWGDTYTPTAQEILAYFYGWVMYDGTGTPSTKYNGTGTKFWAYRASNFFSSGGTPNAGNMGGGANILPTAPSPSTGVFAPYKLIYQLATPTFEEIQVDAGMSLHEGLNQIEVGQGVVLREKVTPPTDTVWYYISDIRFPSGNTKNRIKKILYVYKNGRVDNKWTVDSSDNSYGINRAFVAIANYDPTATYEVSFIALDQYALSAPVQAVNGEVASNLKTVVDTLSTNQADLDARISASEIVARRTYDIQKQIGNVLNPWGDNTRDNRSRVVASHTSLQTIANNTWIKLLYNVKNKDNLSEYDASVGRFTAKGAGTYLVSISMSWTNSPSGMQSQIKCSYNGVIGKIIGHMRQGSSGDVTLMGSIQLDVEAGDYLEFYINHTSGSNQNTNPDTSLSYLTITRIA